MANRFQKSIESVEQNNKPMENKTALDTDIGEQTSLIPNMEFNISSNIKDNTLNNILDNIIIDEQRGKNVTFYLSSEVDEAVNRISKQKKVSKSKLVDNVLKQVLLK